MNAVVEILESEFLTQGPAVPAFERAVAEYCRAAHAVAVNSATSALHIACLALDVGPGDVVWTSPITFVASANCALYCGARPDFVDIDPRTFNLSVPALAEKLARADREGGLPKVVIPVHFAGQSCDMAGIRALADRYGFRIIEDASHAIGGRYRNEPVGNGRYSDITVFSFHPVKIITTAEGGLAVTNDAALATRMALLRSHGITRDTVEMTGAAEGAWHYQQIDLGFNYRLTDLQAALGRSQLSRIEEFVARRRDLRARYDAAMAELPVSTQWEHPDSYSATHLYVICLDQDRVALSRREVFDQLRAAGVGVNVHYIPVYLQPYYQRLGFGSGYCPEAERYYAGACSLPMYFGLTDETQAGVLSALRAILRGAERTVSSS